MFKELKLQDVFLIVIAHGRYWAQPVPGVDTFTLKTPSQICAASVWVLLVRLFCCLASLGNEPDPT